MREIEIKIKVKDLESIKKQLEEKGCILSNPISQRDVIYSKDGDTQEWGNAKEGDITIRIRHLNNGAELTLKKQKSSELDNLEYETEVKDPEALHNILLTLGYTPIVEVKKVRQKGRMGKYEICLDQVEQLGSFVELETLTSDDVDPERTQEELYRVIESFGLSRNDEEVRGYDTQIYQLSH